MQLSLVKRLLSYLYPIRVRSSSSAVNPVLELFYFRGRWQLGTPEALYSDGTRYRPLLTAFRAIRRQLPEVKNVLVLGTGLGSAVEILQRQGFRPWFTLVELDQQVLEWALELLPRDTLLRINPVCCDARDYVDHYRGRYDLIIVDVFKGRVAPDFVTSVPFLSQCRQRLTQGGRLVLNYMVNTPDDIRKAKDALEAIFSSVQELQFGINRVYLATA